jgi:hypothetical protein
MNVLFCEQKYFLEMHDAILAHRCARPRASSSNALQEGASCLPALPGSFLPHLAAHYFLRNHLLPQTLCSECTVGRYVLHCWPMTLISLVNCVIKKETRSEA